MQTVELKACAHCGGSNLKEGFIRATDEMGWFFVECECGAQVQGPTAKNASGLWNTRFEASLPPSAPVGVPKPWTMDAARELHAGMIQAARDRAGSHGAPQSEVREAGSMFLYRALLALPPSGIAEMVREMCAAKADQNAASCRREAESLLPGIGQLGWLRAAEEIGMTASTIRSLDLSNKGVG